MDLGISTVLKTQLQCSRQTFSRDSTITLTFFIDLRKAFDTVNHTLLLNMLSDMGFEGVVYNWFDSYLANRYQHVQINGNQSGKVKMTHGVPPGEVLAPQLFLYVINSLYEHFRFSNCIHIGGSKGVLLARVPPPPPAGSNSFIFPYVFTESTCVGGRHPPMAQHPPPPTGNPGSTTVLFADDTTIYVIGKSPKCLKLKLQNDLNNIAM